MNNDTTDRRKEIISDAVFAAVMGILLALLILFWPWLTALPK